MVTEMYKLKKKKTAGWQKNIIGPLANIMKEKQKSIKAKEKIHRKTMKDQEKIRIKTMKAKEKIHRKAIKARKKRVEKNVDRLLVGGCFLVCLTAALMEAREDKKKKKVNE